MGVVLLVPGRPDAANADSVSSETRLVNRAFVEHQEPLKRFISRRVASADDTEDILQDVYVRIVRSKGLFLIDNIRAFLYKTALNLVRDHHRKSKNRSAVVFVEEYDEKLMPQGLSPERVLSARQRLRLIEAALHDMPPKYLEALIMSRFHGKTYDEIAETMGVTVRSVQTYIARAVDMMDQKLQAAQESRHDHD